MNLVLGGRKMNHVSCHGQPGVKGRFSGLAQVLWRRCQVCTVVLIVIALSLNCAWCGELVVFGDSLTDSGNLFIASGAFIDPVGTIFDPGSPYSRFPTPPFSGGRATNGPVWIEMLAAHLRCVELLPSEAGGTNYAFISALTKDDFDQDIVSPFGAPDIESQVTEYLATHTPSSSDVFVIWGGANDFFFGQTDPTAPVAAIALQVIRLAEEGAKHIVVLNLPPLGYTPSGASANPDGLNALSYYFNQYLAVTLDALRSSLDVNIYEVDMELLFQVILNHPEWFGLANVTEPAVETILDRTSLLFGFPVFPTVVARKPNRYLFWDGVHPTKSGHRLIADYVCLSMMLSRPRHGGR